MIYAPAEEIRSRAESFVQDLGPIVGCKINVIAGNSIIGGGTAPTTTLPTFVIAITCDQRSSEELMTRLRRQSPPVIARIEGDRLVLDLRTVAVADEQIAANCLRASLG